MGIEVPSRWLLPHLAGAWAVRYAVSELRVRALGPLHAEEEKARRAIDRISEPFGLSTTDAALGILRLANANMQAALERVSIERGYDPRDFALVASGGAGPLHGAALTRELRLRKLIVPRAPGQFSAWGMLMTDLRHDFIRTHILPCDRDRLPVIRSEFKRLEQEAADQYAAEGVSPERISIDRYLDLRYRGQEHTVRTPVDAEEIEAGRLDAIGQRFHELHDKAYSFRQDDPIEVVNFHVTAWGLVDKPEPRSSTRAEGSRPNARARKGERSVIFEGEGAVESGVYERSLLSVGERVDGPAVIEEPACTTIVYPEQRAAVDSHGNLVITEVTA